MRRWFVPALVAVLASPAGSGSGMSAAEAVAATPARADTLAVEIPGIVVTALRGRDRLADVPAATFVLGREELRRSGAGRVSSLLAALPGLYGYRQTSNGDVGVVDPRGFTANGESSYLKLLVNGQDVRDVENGNVDWDWLSPDDVERVEIIEGPGAWLYGDAAEGGIVNVVRAEPTSGLSSDCAVRAGSFGFANASLVLSGAREHDAASLHGAWREVDGWRSHSRERVASGSGEARSSFGPWTLSLDALALDADRQNPGTLVGAQLAADREQSETPWDFDHARRIILGAHLRRTTAAGEWSLSPFLRGEDTDQIRTLFFTPMFHPTRAWTGGADLAWRSEARLGDRPLALTAAADAEHARLRSSYDEFTPGVGTGARVGDGTSWRTVVAGSAGARLEIDPHTALRVGVRGDLARVHSEDGLAGTETDARTFSAVSPMVALQRRIGADGSAYASVGTAFRIPTLNQLFDRRPFFNPFPPPDVITLSNARLDPQRSVSVEVGGRIDGAGGAYASATLYSVRVRDEIDFDFNTLGYANISRSWHRGAQIAARQPLPSGVYAAGSATWQPTTFDGGGDSDGKQINGVPEALGHLTLGWEPAEFAAIELGANFVGRQFLDKLEQHPLAGFTTLDLGVASRIARVRGTVRITNLLDREYSDTGFFDDLLQEDRFSPAAPRGVQVSLRFD